MSQQADEPGEADVHPLSTLFAVLLASFAAIEAVLFLRALLAHAESDDALFEIFAAPVTLIAALALLIRRDSRRLFLVAATLGALAAEAFIFANGARDRLVTAVGWIALASAALGLAATWVESRQDRGNELVAAALGLVCGGLGMLGLWGLLGAAIALLSLTGSAIH